MFQENLLPNQMQCYVLRQLFSQLNVVLYFERAFQPIKCVVMFERACYSITWCYTLREPFTQSNVQLCFERIISIGPSPNSDSCLISEIRVTLFYWRNQVWCFMHELLYDREVVHGYIIREQYYKTCKEKPTRVR